MALKFPKPMQTNEILERCVASIFGSLPTRFIGGLRGEKIAVTTIGESQCLPTSPEYQSRITRKTEKDSIWKITDDSDEILNSLFRNSAEAKVFNSIRIESRIKESSFVSASTIAQSTENCYIYWLLFDFLWVLSLLVLLVDPLFSRQALPTAFTGEPHHATKDEPVLLA